MQLPGQFNALSLPAVDQAVQQKEYNALRNEALQQNAGRVQTEWDDARKQQAQQRLYQMASKSKKMLESGVDWSQLLPEWMQGLQEIGLPTDKIPPAGAAPESVMEGLDNILRGADLRGGNPPIQDINDPSQVPYAQRDTSTGKITYPGASPTAPTANSRDFAEYQRIVSQYGADSDEAKLFQAQLVRPAYGDVGGVRTRSTPIGDTPLTTLDEQAAAEAEILRQKKLAEGGAAAASDRDKLDEANRRTLEVWRVAREGLIASLEGTRTGPVSGRVPAVTAGQQSAEGAIAAVAPVLKQLFRSAGEGIFTDRDQQLLLDMVPKRTDHPESRKSKMEMIDAIIEAKLGSGGSSAPEGTVINGPNGPMIKRNGQWVPYQ